MTHASAFLKYAKCYTDKERKIFSWMHSTSAVMTELRFSYKGHNKLNLFVFGNEAQH